MINLLKNHTAHFINFIILTIILTVLFFAASCADSPVANQDQNDNSNKITTSANADNANSATDDIAELGNRVKLAITPEEVVWREESLAEPTEKKLIAVLRYSTGQANQIAAQAEKIRPAQTSEIGTETWFPEELTAQSQLSGNESLRGSLYAADDFFNPPFTNGKLMRIENTDYFVLELATF